LLPNYALPQSRAIHVEWEYQYNGNVDGFRVYHENTLACETSDPNTTTMECSVDTPDGESWFTITSLLQDGTESPHSSPFSYIFSSNLKAVLNADTLEGEGPLPVTFDATLSTGIIVSYEWVFGDGDIGTGNIVNHTFASAGNYAVTLKITDDKGAIDQKNVSVVVTNPTAINSPPTAVVSSSASVGEAPLQVQFDGTGSSDSDGTILSYKWDMGDGGSSTGPQVTYTYSSAGTFSAKLTTTDDGGLTDTISTPVIAREPSGGINIPPIAVIAASASNGYTPLTVSFNAAESSDPDGEINNYIWYFGDGTNGSGISVKHKFSQGAVYTVTLKVTDDTGTNSQLARHIVTVVEGDGDGDSDDDQTIIPESNKSSKSITIIINLLLNSAPGDNSP